MLGVVGDSAAGKTTLAAGLVRALGAERVSVICTDDYHRYDRAQRAERGITPLHPACNYLDILAQHLRLLYAGEPILKPVYNHCTGTFDPPVYLEPREFVIAEGLHGFSNAALRECFDIKVYLDPPEELRRRWKVQRDTGKRGYTVEQVLAELERRESDSAQFIRPQKAYADIVVRFQPPATPTDDAHLDAHLVLYGSLIHPDLSGVVALRGMGIRHRCSSPWVARRPVSPSFCALPAAHPSRKCSRWSSACRSKWDWRVCRIRRASASFQTVCSVTTAVPWR
jgi:phosphoribulokinase